MKRYLLFTGTNYYPKGGARDYKGSFDSIEDAIDNVNQNDDWANIFDAQTESIVKNLKWEIWNDGEVEPD
jgi:hypothetical protein